ncbi:MAG: GGDEF domain-containing protein [Firmicutes bacterium]|nr:GGDEF domain-containing protein [Alicyclobacillaceae bacterium]MCL6496296.1 GGDEF domain-containing protein [Bacillota bacterium]
MGAQVRTAAMWALIGRRAAIAEVAAVLGVSPPEAERAVRRALKAALWHYLAQSEDAFALHYRVPKATDGLTALGTRAAAERCLRDCLRRARRTGAALAVVFVDVDGLKAINDRFGHGAGDRKLRAVAQALRQAVRRTDQVFRWGGDEFVVVCPGTDAATAAALEVRLRRDLKALGVSIGVGVWSSADDGWEMAVQRADHAMYQEKRRRQRRRRWTAAR